jgi:hypothetical protein
VSDFPVPLLAFDSASAPEFVSGHADLLSAFQGGAVTTTMKVYLDARYDVTDLDEQERGALALEVQAQAEANDDGDGGGHRSVEVEIETNEVEVEVEDETEVLVHLNIAVPAGLDLSADQVAAAVMAAYEVGSEGASDPLYEEMKVVVALAEGG